jgi:hypothetical protein
MSFKILNSKPSIYYLKTSKADKDFYLLITNQILLKGKLYLIAHLFEHYLLKIVANNVQDIYYQGTTDIDGLEFYFKTKNALQINEILKFIFSLNFNDLDIFEKQVDLIINEYKKDYLNVHNILYDISFKKIFPQYKFFTRDEQIKMINSIKLSDLEKFFNDYFLNKNLKIFIGANKEGFRLKEILTNLKNKNFKNLPATKLKRNYVLKNRFIILDSDYVKNQDYYCFIFNFLPYKITKIEEVFLLTIIFAYLKLKIEKIFRDFNVYQIFFSLYKMFYRNYCYFHFLVNQERNLKNCLAIFFNEIHNLEKNFDKKLFLTLLKNTKNDIISNKKDFEKNFFIRVGNLILFKKDISQKDILKNFSFYEKNPNKIFESDLFKKGISRIKTSIVLFKSSENKINKNFFKILNNL